MLKLEIPDMSCGHCAATIEQAVRSVDPAAEIEIDLVAKITTIRSSADAAPIRDAVRAAGYDNRLAAG